MSKKASDPGVPLSEVVETLRQELIKAMELGKKQSLRFKVSEATVELEVAVTKEAEANGGVKFWVYEAGGKGKLGTESVQRITLKLNPVDKEGKDTLISGTRTPPPAPEEESES